MKEIKSTIVNAKEIGLFAHINPDIDAISSLFSKQILKLDKEKV